MSGAEGYRRPNVVRERLQKAKCREMTEPVCTMLQKAEPAGSKSDVLGDDCWSDASSGWPHGWSCGGGVAGSRE
ncbi:hypothetical protein AXF42_Ash013494 [Apostasia shenzhenica]|uniref:Uncharacterized protein n=1 Tax=Apostasia shenzhenica TaxID=1088818 RepID=A0A2I0A4D3_9ASPA|nr:hypothetical protein AXF42_Ash013494 [Apostasia shenzhenica]